VRSRSAVRGRLGTSPAPSGQRRLGRGPAGRLRRRNAREDLAQSVMYFFVDPVRLKKGDGRGRAEGTWGNPCPKRFAFIQKVVAGWTKKR